MNDEIEWPELCIHDDFYTGPSCKKCSSDFPKKHKFFGKRYCINEKCSLSEEQIALKKYREKQCL